MLSLQHSSVQSFALDGLPRHLSQPSLSTLKLAIPRRETRAEEPVPGLRQRKPPIRVAAKAIAGRAGKWPTRVTSPKVKSVTLVEQGKLSRGFRERKQQARAEESDLLGYSSDSMMTGGEIVLMNLYDRSKKLQAQTRKKGITLDCRALSPRSPALQPPRLTDTKKHTDALKVQLSSLGRTWGVHFHWESSNTDPFESVNLAGKLAHVGHKITQETLRVLGNR